jgi:hypothetical protein
MSFPDENDDWADLARELARDKPKPVETTPSEDDRTTHQMERRVSAGELDGGTPSERESLAGVAAETADGSGDMGRKRRRRRRRRRRGGEDSADAPMGAASEGEDEAAEGEPAEGGFEGGEVGFADEVEAESDTEVLAVDSEMDEDAGEELLRELIANWNVPSWDDVVGGLYRPER